MVSWEDHDVRTQISGYVLMTAIRYRTLGLLMAGIAGLSFLVAAGPAEAGDGLAPDRRTGSIAGRITFATVADDEFFELTDAVVYLTGEGLTDLPGAAQADPAVARLDQIDYTFVPRVLAVVVGTELRFHNSDSELHNIHTVARGRPANRMFNRSQLPGSTFNETFEQPDSILVSCDIHSQMIAHILVLPNSFHTMPVADGSYSLAGVPPGRYELTAWHEFFGRATVPVMVVSGAVTAVDVAFSGPLE
jgi:plastocyanin